MNVQIAYNLFLVDHEAYCSEQSIVYYRFNVQKFVDFLSDQIGSAPDLIECDVISREWCLHISPSSGEPVVKILLSILISEPQRCF